MKKSKGFTLVELLAVIVILAVLVLFATPAVTSIMQNSQKKTFKNEVLDLVKQVETVYSTKVAEGAKRAKNDDTLTNKIVYNLDNGINGGVSYKYLCMGLDDLRSEGYVNKNFNQYGGYIQIWVNEAGKSTVYVNVFNSQYYMVGDLDSVSASTYLPSQDYLDAPLTGKPAEPTLGNYTCPDKGKLPKDSNGFYVNIEHKE